MTDHPMLFSAPMIRALLDGTKTQTRRILKPQPDGIEARPLGFFGITSYYCFTICEEGGANSTQQIKIPIAIGDRIWARETWSGEYKWHGIKPSEREAYAWEGEIHDPTVVHYWADGEPDFGDWEKTRVSIHMPRAFSRITLLVTEVRVQRLQDISEDDASMEGMGTTSGGLSLWKHYGGDKAKGVWNDGDELGWPDPYYSFASLWNSINGPGAWAENPWVVAYTFEVVKKNIDA